MKNLITTWLFMSLLILSCTNNKKNILTGQIEGLNIGDKIFLAIENPEANGLIPVDSVVVTKNGEFKLTTEEVDNTVILIHLKADEQFTAETWGIFFFLEGYSNLNFTGNTDDWYGLEVTGGIYSHPDLKEYIETEKTLVNLHNNAMETMSEFRQNNDLTFYVKSRKMTDSTAILNNRLQEIKTELLETRPDIAYLASLIRYDYFIVHAKNIDKFEDDFNKLSPRVQATLIGMQIRKFIDNTRASIAGVPAPDFTLNDMNGVTVSLEDYRGKYVLLDFWGSWCAPCRESSPKLVKLYNDLKAVNANIEFIGIACNESNDAEWRKAIEHDKLLWTQLNDAHSEKGKSIKKLYAAEAVPSCVLISPEGNIIRREHPVIIIPAIEDLFELN